MRELQTERLRLRRWRTSDLEPFAALNADPRVMEHFPSTLSREESDAYAARIIAQGDALGFGLWAAEIPGVTPFAGFVGLSVPGFEAHFTPCVEIGWRLAAKHWNRGLATEGAREVLRFARETLGLEEVVSFAVRGNYPSRRVMEKVGMTFEAEFEHPRLAEGHPLRTHVLYRLKLRD